MFIFGIFCVLDIDKKEMEYMNKKKDSDRKTQRIVLVITENDKKTISKRAKDAGCTISAYLRKVGMGEIVSFEDIKPWLDDIDRVNEILRIIKRKGDPELLEEILDLVKRKERT